MCVCGVHVWCACVCACERVCESTQPTQHVQCPYSVGLEGLNRIVHVVLWGGGGGKVVDLVHCEGRERGREKSKRCRQGGGGEGRGGGGEEVVEVKGKGRRNDAQLRERRGLQLVKGYSYV